MQSNITILDTLRGLEEPFSPVMITLNGIVLYDAWNFDETASPFEALRLRLWRYEHYVVTAISIEIVDFHHSFVHLTGKLMETKNA